MWSRCGRALRGIGRGATVASDTRCAPELQRRHHAAPSDTSGLGLLIRGLWDRSPRGPPRCAGFTERPASGALSVPAVVAFGGGRMATPGGCRGRSRPRRRAGERCGHLGGHGRVPRRPPSTTESPCTPPRPRCASTSPSRPGWSPPRSTSPSSTSGPPGCPGGGERDRTAVTGSKRRGHRRWPPRRHRRPTRAGSRRELVEVASSPVCCSAGTRGSAASRCPHAAGRAATRRRSHPGHRGQPPVGMQRHAECVLPAAPSGARGAPAAARALEQRLVKPGAPGQVVRLGRAAAAVGAVRHTVA
jgi:hypothetical protein